MDSYLFGAVYGIMVLAHSAIAILNHKVPGTKQKVLKASEPRCLRTTQKFIAGILFRLLLPASVVSCFNDPLRSWFEQFSFYIDEGIRWAALAVDAVLLVPFSLWCRYHLRSSWSDRAAIRFDQTLVKSGPYRFVRHPMYLGLFAAAATYSLISANWLIAMMFFSYAMLILVRIPFEERLLEQNLPGYRNYRCETATILPHVI